MTSTNLTPSTSKPTASTEWPATAVPETWIDALFERMAASYGSKFADLWRGVDINSVRRLWGIELAKVTREEWKHGVDSLVTRPFPPTLPEFVALCRPPFNLDAAVYEACEQMRNRTQGTDTWSSPAIFWAAVKVGHHDMVTLAHSAIKARFGKAYGEVIAQDHIAPVPKAQLHDLLGNGADGASNAEHAREQLARIRDLIAPIGMQQKASALWAFKLIARHDGGEKLPYGVLKAAVDAVLSPAGQRCIEESNDEARALMSRLTGVAHTTGITPWVQK
jgi:hypothetical protein